MNSCFLKVISQRRTSYAINDASPLSDKEIIDVIEQCVKNAPSTFNCQSSRVAVLFGQSHLKLWDIVKETLKKMVPPQAFARTEQKINSFAAGHGTVLYFEDVKITEGLQAQLPAYKNMFPLWAEQSNGILTFMIWATFCEAGLGASLQHYNPLIDERVREEFDLPAQWRLIAQMPFGSPTGNPHNKTFVALEQRIKIFH
jgi:predicted oxidoreductase (fatty acid repression mutant protein)